jgi:hypothetical protein
MRETCAIGNHTTTYCTPCRLRREHTVVVIDGAGVTTVTCATCGSRVTCPPAGTPRNAQASRAKKGVKVPPSVAPLWEGKMAAAAGTERQYTISTTYRVDDILLHEQFGKGVVVKLATKKCDVLFQDKERLMASIRCRATPCLMEKESAWPVMLSSIKPRMETSRSIRGPREKGGNRRITTLPAFPAPRCPRGFGRCCARRTSAISPAFRIARLVRPHNRWCGGNTPLPRD